jgi:hypothetical protein
MERRAEEELLATRWREGRRRNPPLELHYKGEGKKIVADRVGLATR